MDASSASISVPVEASSTFGSLRPGRTGQSIVGRLSFWDSRNIKKNGEFMGITILLLDELWEDSCNHEKMKMANGIKPRLIDRDIVMKLSTTTMSPSEKQCVNFTLNRKRKKDARSGSCSPEGGNSSWLEDESRNSIQKTGDKDKCYLDSFNA